MLIRTSICNAIAAGVITLGLCAATARAQPASGIQNAPPEPQPPGQTGNNQTGSNADQKRVVQQREEPAVPGEDHVIDRFELKTATVLDGARLIAEASGLNVVTTSEAGQVEVSLFLKNVTARQAVEILSQVSGLWFRADPDTRTIRIMTIDEYQDDLVVYRKDITRVFQLQHPNAVSAAIAIQNLYPGRVQLSLTPINDDQILAITGQTSLSVGGGGLGGGGGGLGGGFGGQGFARAGGGGGLGGGIGGFGGGLGGGLGGGFGGGGFGGGGFGGGGFGGGGFGGGGFGGGGFGGGGFGGGNGFNNLNRYNLNRQLQEDLQDNPLTAQQLRQLDALRLAAGEAEGRVSTDTLGELTSNEPPIYISYVQQHNLLIVRTSDQSAIDDIALLILQLDKPTPQVLLEMKILEVTLDDNFRSIFDFDYTDSGGTPNNGFGANAALTGAAAVQNVLGAGNFPLEGGQLLYQFLDDKIRARIQLLADDNRVNVVGTPMILASNNRFARIFVGEQRVLTTDVDVTTIQNINGPVVQQLDPQTEVRDLGNTLLIQPKINANRTVTLTIIQESSSRSAFPSTIPVILNNTTQEVAVDTVDTSQLQATVVARDNLTTAVGGLIRTTVANRMQKVPWLGDLKYVGRAFRRETRQRLKTELVLLITPRILESGEEAHAVTQDRMAVLSSHPYIKEGDASLEKYLYDPKWYLREPWNPAMPPVSISHAVFDGALCPNPQDTLVEPMPVYSEPGTFPVGEPGAVAVPPAPAYQP